MGDDYTGATRRWASQIRERRPAPNFRPVRVVIRVRELPLIHVIPTPFIRAQFRSPRLDAIRMFTWAHLWTFPLPDLPLDLPESEHFDKPVLRPRSERESAAPVGHG